jgi:hypothetical protein
VSNVLILWRVSQFGTLCNRLLPVVSFVQIALIAYQLSVKSQMHLTIVSVIMSAFSIANSSTLLFVCSLGLCMATLVGGLVWNMIPLPAAPSFSDPSVKMSISSLLILTIVWLCHVVL